MSVKVHPDKHPSFPEASTQAFQRVSEAFSALKDEAGRRQYASELRQGRASDFAPRSSPHEQGDNVHNKKSGWRSSSGVSASQAAAFFAAAFAAEMAAGHIHVPGVDKAMGFMTSAGELAVTLSMAEQLINSKS